ncbi:DinB family protein [Chitinophaga ginsengisegetis]|uniref:DinB family protein n=1 Tax=Chitinophaga ginsengisegetis TaxID=393003 RepID=UPI000DB9BFEF|nr:DinB family protein [Chitinophaga ginsengisegetis]MDR6570106.1 putative damage-inducible protein DinB [Chitinophaga ginsengisegetis]MDR6649840.1 putative damage-inducible protein DinB [Chitinophaga ginsengisegetis]MDR6655957.1 putative damage-inducible protein DinB [Chitinophaga ginsengisegetis]
MRIIFVLPFLLISFFSYSQTATIKSILLDQLRTTHDKAHAQWFVTVNTAIEGLTSEEANWKDSSGNHSIAQLVNHLIFWDLGLLEKFNGKAKPAADINNDDTFSPATKEQWEASVKRIDSVLTAWETAIEQADEKKLVSQYSTIANINTHNAYHIGQILYIRKLRGNWNPEKGVK